MLAIRDRWLVFATMVLLLAVGNHIANYGSPVREAITYLFLLIGCILFVGYDQAGWISQFYFPESANKISAGGDQTGWLVLSTLTACYVICVQLTGALHSPLFCVLYLVPLLTGLRFGVGPALGISLLFATGYFGRLIASQSLPIIDVGYVLSFPLAALFGTVLRLRFLTGLNSISEKVEELGALMDISHMLETAVDIQTTVNLLHINAARAFNADICALYMMGPGNKTLSLSAISNEVTTLPLRPTISVTDLESGSWRLSSDEVLLGSEAAYLNDIWPEKQSHSSMAASLNGSEGVLGLLYVARSRSTSPFGKADQAAMSRFSMHVSMPLQRALFQERLSNLAFRDQMTDLANYRYFEQRLGEELIRAKRYKGTITILLLDIDHFKRFNDDYGHKAGDSLLKQFGAALKKCLRDSDLPARYGGEEFIVICPAITSAEAKAVAERIRALFEHTEFDLGESLIGESARARITVSIGCATFPDNAEEPADLVRQADRALYSAKSNGRNIVVSCDDIPALETSVSSRSAA